MSPRCSPQCRVLGLPSAPRSDYLLLRASMSSSGGSLNDTSLGLCGPRLCSWLPRAHPAPCPWQTNRLVPTDLGRLALSHSTGGHGDQHTQ